MCRYTGSHQKVECFWCGKKILLCRSIEMYLIDPEPSYPDGEMVLSCGPCFRVSKEIQSTPEKYGRYLDSLGVSSL